MYLAIYKIVPRLLLLTRSNVLSVGGVWKHSYYYINAEQVAFIYVC